MREVTKQIVRPLTGREALGLTGVVFGGDVTLGMAGEAVEEKYKFEDLEDTKIKEKFDQDKLSAATPYILGMRKAEQERAEYSRQAMGARRTGQEDMPEETAPAQPPTPEPVKPKWADLLPMKPSQRKANQAEEKAPDKPVEAPPTVVEEGEMPKRQTIMENLEAAGEKQKEKLQA